ncbi:MAG TPA: ComEC/Rec2 family competence protein [Candidatus Acidoferrales bacterium]|nr:ComEC/Rec2 family competence protein [Candidatus Acidoferrales bacterium]
MKAPALWLLSSFAIGIGVARWHPPAAPLVGIACGLFGIAFACWCSRADRLAVAFAMLAWIALGSFAAAIPNRFAPANRVTSLISSGALDLSQPLRWRGVLRSDPLHLPWGWRFEMGLESVEIGGNSLPVVGGLRATYYGDEPSLPGVLRAGDRIELLTKAIVPHNYGDPGAFDYRAQLAREGVDLTATLRSLELMEPVAPRKRSIALWFARLRGTLLKQIDNIFGAAPQQAAVFRAMLLGDRSFVGTEIADQFRKTSSYHVLVIAGLHVGALAAFIFWMGRRLRLGLLPCSLCTLVALTAYLMIVQDRPPILRAVLMAAFYLLAAALFRRLDILQAAALAALAILLIRPDEITDPSFQMSFLAMGAIGGIAMPWLARTSEPLRRALVRVNDETRDPGYSPRLVQLRLDIRLLASQLSAKLSAPWQERCMNALAFLGRSSVLLWELCLLSLVIQAAMLPLSATEFHRLSLLGPIANVGAVLLTAAIVPAGFATLAIGSLWRTGGHLLARIAIWLTSLLLADVRVFARMAWSGFRVPDPPRWLFIGLLATLALVALFARRRAAGAHLAERRRVTRPKQRRVRSWARVGEILAVAALILEATATAIAPFAPRLYPGQLETTVLDVGQGDSIFLASPNGKTLLVDGGGGTGAFWVSGTRTRFDVGEEVVSRYLWSRGLKHLDAIALTHAHEDHMEGLHAVLENFRVGELWVGHDVNSAAYRELLETARQRGTRVIHWKQGDVIRWGDLDAEVLWPDSDDAVRQAGNDDSLVLRVRYGAQAVFLAGDIERPVESTLVADNVPLDATFLKVPHHGSKTSSTEDFLARVRPTIAAVSVGENNPFNHPSPEAIARLAAEGARVFRTDRDGAITYLSNGTTAQISAFAQAKQVPRARYWAFLPGFF